MGYSNQRARVMVFVLASFLAIPTLQAQTTIDYPNGIDASIQDAVLRAGCGGTVMLAAGTYSGTDISADPALIAPGFPDVRMGHVFIECGGRLIGAGIDQTIIDGANSPSPGLGSPVIGLGFDPFFVHPITENYELAHMTIKSATATTSQAVATGWSNGVHLHHLKIEGFSTGIRGDLTNGDEIDHVSIRGLAPTTGFCIDFRERNAFVSFLPDGHMVENSIHHNDLGNCFTGINISNNAEISIHHNMIQNTNVALAFRGVEGAEVHHNVLAKNFQRGLNFVNSNNATVHDNTYCQNPIAIRYGPSTSPTLFGYPPSGGNVIHHEMFLGNATDFLLADPGIGNGNTTSLADSNKSISDPTGTCGF